MTRAFVVVDTGAVAWLLGIVWLLTLAAGLEGWALFTEEREGRRACVETVEACAEVVGAATVVAEQCRGGQ